MSRCNETVTSASKWVATRDLGGVSLRRRGKNVIMDVITTGPRFGRDAVREGDCFYGNYSHGGRGESDGLPADGNVFEDLKPPRPFAGLRAPVFLKSKLKSDPEFAAPHREPFRTSHGREQVTNHTGPHVSEGENEVSVRFRYFHKSKLDDQLRRLNGLSRGEGPFDRRRGG